ncbi:MAG: MFS transporter, partial [Candidatus Tectomicrobia bacterium]|nr:MFS transporter [Candidatus Tectomicrobia bacterium]
REGLAITAGDWAFWLLCLTNFMVAALYFANMTWLPGFMVKERGYSIMKTGIYLSLPYLGAILGGLACGYLGDWLKKRSLVGIIFCVLACPAMIGALAAQSFLGTELLLIIALFFSMGAINSIIVLVYDLYPIESFGTAIGIVVGLGGGLSGLIAPLLIGLILDATGSFFWGFSILALGTLAAGGCFAVLLPQEIARKAQKAAADGEAVPTTARQTARH